MEFFESYKINEVLDHRYYQIPQELFENPFYKDLCLESKILYAFLLDRLSLSKKNHWINENGEIYLIFTRVEVQKKLNLSDKTISKAFKQLVDVNLINEKKQGFGKPKLIFVGKIQHQDISAYTENLRVDSRKNYDTTIGENTINDTEDLRTINTDNIKTNIINTDSINPQSEEGEISLNKFKEQCCLEEFHPKDKSILEDVIDTLYNADTLKVGAVTVNHLKILSKLEFITKQNLQQLLDILENTPNIKNVTNYLVRCLYNNLGNTNYKPKKEISNNRYHGREYPEGYLDELCANKYEKDYNSIIANNKELQEKCNNMENEFDKKVEDLESTYVAKNTQLEQKFNNRFSNLEKDFEAKTVEIKRDARKDYYNLERENQKLHRIVDTVKDTIGKFIKWVCRKFDMSAESVVKEFEKENHVYLDPIEQIKHEDREKEDEMELEM